MLTFVSVQDLSNYAGRQRLSAERREELERRRSRGHRSGSDEIPFLDEMSVFYSSLNSRFFACTPEGCLQAGGGGPSNVAMSLQRTAELLAEGDRHRRDDNSGGYGLQVQFRRLGDMVTIDRFASYGTPPRSAPEADGPESCWRPELGPSRVTTTWAEFETAVDEYQRWHLTAFMDEAPWMLDSPLIQRWCDEAGIVEGQAVEPPLTPESTKLRAELQSKWFPPHPVDPHRGSRRWLAQAVWATRSGTSVSMRNVEYPASTAVALARAAERFNDKSPGERLKPAHGGSIVGDVIASRDTETALYLRGPIDGTVEVSSRVRFLSLNGASSFIATEESEFDALNIEGIIDDDFAMAGEVRNSLTLNADVGGDVRITGEIGASRETMLTGKRRKRPMLLVGRFGWVSGDLVIDGVVHGDVALDGSVGGDVILGPSGRITGDLKFGSSLKVDGTIRIRGYVEGNLDYYPKNLGTLAVREDLIAGEARLRYTDPADRRSETFFMIAARRPALQLWHQDPRPTQLPEPPATDTAVSEPFYRYIGTYGPLHTAKSAYRSFQGWEAIGRPPLDIKRGEGPLAKILWLLGGGALQSATVSEGNHKLKPASLPGFLVLRTACALRTILALDPPDQAWELALIDVWHAAETEWEWAYYADNNRDPVWSDEYYLQRRADAMTRLEQAERDLQAVATQQRRPMPARSTYPAYQGLHWGVDHIITCDPIHLDEFINAQQTNPNSADRHEDDRLAGQLAWAAIHQLDQALLTHQRNPTTRRS